MRGESQARQSSAPRLRPGRSGARGAKPNGAPAPLQWAGGAKINSAPTPLSLARGAMGLLSGLNTILLDMVFSIGEIGKGLLSFLTRTSVCGVINNAYSWFLNVWCEYLQNYLAKLLTTLRSAISMVAAGFEILQDFMDEVFQGVLQATSISKYDNSLFQKTLIEKYSQPSVERDAAINIVTVDDYIGVIKSFPSAGILESTRT